MYESVLEWLEMAKNRMLCFIASLPQSLMMEIGALIGVLMVLQGCGTIRYIPVEGETRIEYRDSVILRADTVYVDVPVESHRDYSGLQDTLRLETGVAEAECWADIDAMRLNGVIRNKRIRLEKEVVFKDRIVYRDSIVVRNVPYPVEVEKRVVPKWCWWLLAVNGICLLVLGLRVCFRFAVKRAL